MTPKEEFHFSLLLVKCLDGSISEQELAELNERLRTDLSAAKIYAEQMYINSNLNYPGNLDTFNVTEFDFDTGEFDAEIANYSPKPAKDSNVSLRGVDLSCLSLESDTVEPENSGLTQEMVEILGMVKNSPAVEIPKEEPKRELIQKVESDFKWFPGRPSKRKIRSLLAMAACVLVTIGYMYFFGPKNVDRPVVAKLSDSIEAVWDNELQIPDEFGDMVQSRYRLKKGFISILFNDGAKVTVEAPAELSLDSPSAMELFSGRIYSIVPNRAKGFAVKAASSKIVDLGTEFGVEVDSGGNTQLHVTKGRTVLFAGLLDGKKDEFNVDAGAGKKIYNDGFVKDIPLADRRFVRQIDSKNSLILKGRPVEVIYEPFDYSGAGLNGQSGYNETGFAGIWKAHVPHVGEPQGFLNANTLTYGKLPATGGSLKTDYAHYAARFGGTRSIAPEALSGSGLLENGATAWFSVLIGVGEEPARSSFGNNSTNSWLAFALASDSFKTGRAGPKLMTGEGVGIYLRSRFLYAAGYAASGVIPAAEKGPEYKVGEYNLVVCKITWGDTDEADDTIEVYMPYKDLMLPSEPVSTLNTRVDQSAFDTLTFSVGDVVLLDEIRFGKSYSDVLGGR